MAVDLVAPMVLSMGAYDHDRARLLGALTGRVLEIGAGRGANFRLLPADVEWIGLEPNRSRRRQLVQEWEGASVLDAPAEQVPLPAGSVDAVVSTIVLCSVRDPGRVVDEALRVLRPGGRFVFFEHVAAPRGTWTRRWQGLAAPFSRMLDHGCDPTRDTARTLSSAPFETLHLQWYARGRWPLIGGYGVA